MNKLVIQVPASTANLGPGFDSVGISLNRFLTLKVYEHHEWKFEQISTLLPPLPDNDDHFILQIAKQVADHYHKSLPPCRVVVDSEIPLARGLGSSASAVVAGIELANQVGQLSLTDQEKLYFASNIEGHPDNVAASLFGGLIIATKNKENGFEVVPFYDLMVDFLVFIPNIELKTDDARKVLPSSYSRQDAVRGSATSNVLIAALLCGQYELAGKMMEQDIFHEPYRSELIPHFHEVREAAKTLGAFGTVISGAGPTIISLVPYGDGERIAKHLRAIYPQFQIEILKMNRNGVVVEYDASYKALKS
ncbi:homoserine kinase [Heyndrickxia ginsengihumi]|uniref:Homoserine kinase n=1 Tax=Heyndrickxia ginsengihumi TaxID=363870 RepID=A0A6M0P7N5_9BACI|nr:homoserine kinase [Heyndrickxia ginsengihumi]MBE6182899.1 homoserine kinase [Bacillus sp. (in: firmicutes)]MCM3023917.1 homoserine kinase [Heyndrickxia ginsengihumi]NEY19890.1 homoserine kinase [Heyndrickxia ginsengihumi]